MKIRVHWDAFFNEWTTGVPNAQLQVTWDLNAIKGSQARSYNVTQITLATNYRLLFADERTKQILYLLEVFRKTSTYRVNIAHAIERACNIWGRDP